MKSFRKGDRVQAFGIYHRPLGKGVVVEDTNPNESWTRVQYDDMPAGHASASATSMLEYVTTLTAETQRRSFCVEIPDPAKFLILSEGTALDEELMRAGASRIEANGHYGSAYFFTLDEEDVPNMGRFLQIIERHLALLDLNKEH